MTLEKPAPIMETKPDTKLPAVMDTGLSDPTPPPVYAATASRDSGYASDAPPPSYYSKIGKNTIGEPLVTVAELKAHLRLLRAFSDLKQLAQKLDAADLGLPLGSDKEMQNERKWPVFVALAVERFERFCLTLSDAEMYGHSSDYSFLPPLDVFMVWHAYLLNPQRYAEDLDINFTMNRLGKLDAKLDNLESVVSILTSPASPERVDNWRKKTGLPFDYFESARSLNYHVMTCPKCLTQSSVALLDANAQGYLQQSFSSTCRTCDLVITKETLAMHKLVKDLTREGQCLPGTLHSATSLPDPKRAGEIKARMRSHSIFVQPKGGDQNQWIRNIQETQGYSLARLHAAMRVHMRGRGAGMLTKIMTSYTDDRVWSLDLVGAVLRQESFIRKMTDLRWTSVEFFEDPEDKVLVHSIARYHAFLDLMSSSPASFFVPTLDIDLAWHTHQLRSKKYNADCAKYVQRFVDHNDRVEEDRLSNAFDITCRAWEERFHIRYTHCGCPAPGDKVSKRLSRFLGVQKDAQAPSELVPPADREDLLAATHPSDHNAVYAFSHAKETERARAKRIEKREKREKREAEKNAAYANSEKRREYGHDPAFLMPMPLYYGYGIVPVGCVAMAGTVVGAGGGTAACATGAGGCGGGCGGSGGCGGGCGGGACGGGGGGGCGGGGGGGGCGGGGGS